MLVFTTVAWGAMFAVAKSALAELDAFWLSTVRYIPAAMVMLAIVWLVEGRDSLSPRGAVARLWLFGSIGFAGFSILGFLGLAQSRPEHAAIIAALMPLITSMMNWIFRGQRPGALTLGATLVALAGALLVITHGRLEFSTDGTLHADAMVLAGVTCWVAYTMGAAEFPQFSPLRYTALSMSFGAVTITGLTLVATAAGFAQPPTLDVLRVVPLELVYLSLVGGVMAVLAWNAGIGILGPANGVLFINLLPITAFAIGVAQGHRFGASEIAGVLMVIGALVINNVATRAPIAAPATRGARRSLNSA
jgi:drug/metabolite transporter (DMT)-like permease